MGEVLVLRVHAQALVVGDVHRRRRRRARPRSPRRRRRARAPRRGGATRCRPRCAGSARPSGSCRRCRRRPPSTRPGRSRRRCGTRPSWSWWPSERHSRAVWTSSSRPGAGLELLVAGRAQVADDASAMSALMWNAAGARPASRPSTPGRGSSATGTPRPPGRSCCGALAREVERRVAPAQRVGGRVRVPCRSAPAARRSRCPRTRGRRSRGRSGPWPGSPAARRARPPAACGRARSARPAGARSSPSISTSARVQKSSRYSRWRSTQRRPSRCAWRRRDAPRRPGRAPTAASAGSTSRRRGTW